MKKHALRGYVLFAALVIICAFCAACLVACGGGTDNRGSDAGADSGGGTQKPAHIHEYGAWRETEPATCTENGKRECVCECGDKQIEIIPSLGHFLSGWRQVKAASCSEYGEEEQTCGVCDFRETRKIEKLEHSFDHYDGSAPTCTQDGYEEYDVCFECGYSTYKTIEKLGHDIKQHDSKQATCSDIGWNAYEECLRCDYSTYEEIAPHHDFSDEWSHNDETHWKAALCEHGDLKAFEAVHNWQGSSCSDCGFTPLFTPGLKFTKSDEYNYSVSVGTATGEIIIPSRYNGIAVSRIGAGAFDSAMVTSVIIPDSVTYIAAGAFKGCGALERITLPFLGESSRSNTTNLGIIFGTKTYTGAIGVRQYRNVNSSSVYYIPESLRSVTVLGGNFNYGSFYGCSQITEVHLPGAVNAVPANAFYNCAALSNVNLENGIQSIDNAAFYGCAFTEISLPDGVTTVEQDAFRNCANLYKVTLPESLTSVSDKAFLGCNITEAIIPTAAISAVVAMQKIETVTVTCGNIAAESFKNCGKLTSVELRSGVLGINERAFMNCTSLERVSVPSSVTFIGQEVFRGCGRLGELSLPFVGDRLKAETAAQLYPFGYIFGNESYEGSVSVCQTFNDPDSSNKVTSYYHIPQSLTHVTVLGGNLYYGAFENCASIVQVVLGDDVSGIYERAFNGCASLSRLDIPDGVKNIGDMAFCGCKLLESVRIGAGAEAVGTRVFAGCTRLKSLTVSEDNEKYYASGNCIVSGNTLIAGSENAVLPDGVRTVGARAFEDCSALTDLSIPDTVETISAYAFANCASVGSVSVPDSVTFIGNGAFRGCGSLLSVHIGKGLQSLGSTVFAYCSSVESITVDNGNTVYRSEGNCLLKGNVLEAGCKNSIIPSSGVGDITAYAFMGCSGLTSIDIPSVANIGMGAFEDCVGLTSITVPFVGQTLNGSTNTEFAFIFGGRDKIPSSLKSVVISGGTKIKMHAFLNCKNISSVTIGAGVTEIERLAFRGCDGLTKVTFAGGGRWALTLNTSSSPTYYTPTVAATNAYALTTEWVDYNWKKA